MRELPRLGAILALALLVAFTVVGGHLRITFDDCDHDQARSSLTAFRLPIPEPEPEPPTIEPHYWPRHF